MVLTEFSTCFIFTVFLIYRRGAAVLISKHPSARPIPPSILGYKELPLIERDLARAQQLLDDAGYSDGFDLTLTYNIESIESREVAEVIRNSLDEVGITISIKGLDWESAIDEYLDYGTRDNAEQLVPRLF